MGVALDSGAVALDNALEAVALADAGDIHPVALRKRLAGDDVAHVQALAVSQAELLQFLLQHALASLLQMSQFRLGELALGHVLVAQLNGVVAVLLLGLLLHHSAGARLNDGDRDDAARFVEDLRHADLLADDGLFHVSFSSLIKVIG